MVNRCPSLGHCLSSKRTKIAIFCHFPRLLGHFPTSCVLSLHRVLSEKPSKGLKKKKNPAEPFYSPTG